MLAIQCKLCGGDIEITPGEAIGTCAYCGNANTYPKTEDESKIRRFNDANNLRREQKFDEALVIYEKMLEEDRNDAELHWCCALARFGVVYEEDPDTFAWVPSCHRTTMENFLEDADYLAAIQGFQGIEKRRCQQDAEKIADVENAIRQGAQEVEPFDVFLAVDDSALMSEIKKLYDQLSANGCRVFYAPVTLENKGKIEREAITYAALSSAQSMVIAAKDESGVVSPKVKNDWIRFLMPANKKKKSSVFVCCPKDLGAKLPKELAGVTTMGLSGESFMEEALENIGEVLGRSLQIQTERQPEPKPEPVVEPEKPVEAEKKPDKKESKKERKKESKKSSKTKQAAVTQTAPQPEVPAQPEPEPEKPEEPQMPIEDLLRDGFQYLKSNLWEMAGESFDLVLGRQPENGRAYFGKYLLQYKYRDEEDFVNRIRQDMAIQDGESVPYTGDIEKEIEDAVEKYQVPNYLDRDRIAGEFSFKHDYTSAVKNQQNYYDQLKSSIQEDKLLARACQDDTDGFGSSLNLLLKKLFEELSEMIEKSKKKDEQNRQKIQAQYNKHIEDKKVLVAKLSEEAQKQREQEYMEACGQITEARFVEDYQKLAGVFDKLAGYKNANQFKSHCESKVLNAVDEDKKKKKKKVLAICGGAAAVVVIIVAILLPKFLRYRKAVGTLEAGNYESAVASFKELGSYLDSEEKTKESLEKYIEQLQNSNSYEQAQQIINDNFSGWDRDQMLQKCYLAEAQNTPADTSTHVASLEKLIDLLTDESSKNLVQGKLDEYYYHMGNEAAEAGNFNSALGFYKKVKSEKTEEAADMEILLEKAMKDPLYEYTQQGVTWKLDSCIYDGKKKSADQTQFAGIHSRIDNEKMIYYVTFGQNNVDLKDTSNLSRIAVKVSGASYTLNIRNKTITITGKDAKKKKVVSQLSCR